MNSPKSTPLRKLGYVATVLVGFLAVISISGCAYQHIAETVDQQTYPMPGELVDAGNVQLHFFCTGPAEKQPTIILSPGMGSVSSTWANVQSALSPTHHVCSYDRDGLGWSEDSGLPRDAAIAAQRLKTALISANISGPYVLVGHSYGGLVTRIYADEYPADIVGLVFADSAHQDMGERFPEEAQEGFRFLLGSFAILHKAHYTGLVRLFGIMEQSIEGLDGFAHDASMARLNSIAHMRGSAFEAAGWDRSAERARSIQSFGNIPLVVLVAGDWPEVMKPSWIAMQTELSELSSQSTLEIVEGANHPRIVMDPAFSPWVVAAIRRVLPQGPRE